MKEGVYEVRAELPGVDPTDDIEVTVRDGQLTIKAERTQTSESNGHSEFSYGSFVRTVALPRAPTRTTSTPPTTGASSPCRSRSPRTTRPRSTSRSSRPSSSTRTTTMTTTDDDEDDDDQPQLEEAEHTEDEEQHQPVG